MAHAAAPAPGSPAAPARAARPGRGWRWLAGGLGALLALGLALAFFPWDWLRGPLNREVSRLAGRHFEVTRRLDVKLGAPIRILADGLVFANPAWARDAWLVQAEGAEIELRLLPLLRGRVELPRVVVHRPRVSLEMLPDGRRTWALGAQGDRGDAVAIGALAVDRGELRFLAPHLGADLRAEMAIDEHATLPLRLRGGGLWHGQPVTAEGRTGSVLALRGTAQRPFPFEAAAAFGRTRLKAQGTVIGLSGLDAADLALELRGADLSDLYAITGLVLPGSGPYAIDGRVRHDGARWRFDPVAGRLGRSDIAGRLELDRSGAVPRLVGELRSRQLDLDDLGPLVGVPQGASRAPGEGGRVLPRTRLETRRLQQMEADVHYTAQRLVNVRQLPLQRLATRARLQGAVLRLDPLDAGVAAGSVAGWLEVDGRERPGRMRMDLRAQGLQLERLLPGVELARGSVGALQGRAQLAGRGDTVAALLADASGDLSLLMGRGRISNLLLEIAGLDGAEILKFFMGGDQQVQVRCAAAGFAVRQGVMTARPLVLDTEDTVIWGEGRIDLARETLDLTFHPRPKDRSILALRAPLRLEGTLGAPRGQVDRGALAGRAGAVLALGAINPLLGLAATVETGPGRDVDCPAVLRQAAAPASAPASGSVRR